MVCTMAGKTNPTKIYPSLPLFLFSFFFFTVELIVLFSQFASFTFKLKQGNVGESILLFLF